jgi:hypothetical protein
MTHDTVFTMDLATLRKNVTKAKQRWADFQHELQQLLPGLTTLPADDRKHSDGKIRDGEDLALTSVLDVAERDPQLFTVLATKDGGEDPKKFETALLRDRLERRTLLAGVLAEDHVTAPLADTVLALGEQSKPVLLAAYHIAKPLAQEDDTIRARLAPALDFYGRIGRLAVANRAPRSTDTSK